MGYLKLVSGFCFFLFCLLGWCCGFFVCFLFLVLSLVVVVLIYFVLFGIRIEFSFAIFTTQSLEKLKNLDCILFTKFKEKTRVLEYCIQ